MKNLSAPLLALLATGNYVYADLWTITLSGGVVVRWTSHDQPITYLGNTFAKGPMIERGSISERKGLEVATLDMAITATNDTDFINGAPLIPFIKGHGLDGANVKLERAYAADWTNPVTIVGSVIRFAGKVTSINSIKGARAEVTVSSWLVLLNASSPRNLFQAGCLHTLYDTECGLNPTSFRASGSVTSGGTGFFTSNLTGVAGYYNQGRVVFTSGPNAGISRTVKTINGSGRFALVQPLPVACAIGDTFYAYAGCDLAQATCQSKFNNINNFKGTPFVPLPTTAIGQAATTTTSGGKW
jgi:uncharacterized phage protein (TIGR02218 family)